MDLEFKTIIMAVISAVTSSGFISLILYFMQRRDRKRDKEDAVQSAQAKMLLGLGHDKILQITDRIVRRGCITLKEKRNLEYLWVPYDSLHGNGDCKIGYDACQLLPVVSEEKAEEIDIEMKRKNYYGCKLKGDSNDVQNQNG